MTSSSASAKLSTTIRPVPGSQARPLHKIQSTPALTSVMTTPTATVQPTLLNVKHPVVGTVSPVRQPSYQAYPGPSSGASVYGGGGGYVGGYYAPNTPGYVGYNAYNLPGYQQPGYAGHTAQAGAGGSGQPQPGPYPGPGPQPYFIASASGQPFPGSLLPVTTSAVTGQAQQAQGFLCGPYSYPGYSGGRVIGPIIAIAPGAVGGSPILNIPNATATSQTQQPPQQPLSSRGTQELQNKGKEASKPQGKAMPIMSATMSADQALFRNILPKNRDMKHKTAPATVGGFRPMQVVGPIANNPGLVATVLPNLVTSVSSSLTSTTSSVTKIVTGVSKEAATVKRESDSPVVLRHVSGTQRHREDFQAGLKSFVDGKFEKSKEKLENTVRGIQMKNTASPLLPTRSLQSLPKINSLSDIVSVPANSHVNFPSKRTTDCTPIVTVTVKSKSGTVEEDHHIIKRPKDWTEIVKNQRIVSKSSPVKPTASNTVTPLKVPKPTFQFLENDKSKSNQNKSSPKQSTSELPTFHIPHLSDSSEPGPSLGHPGLPFGLQRMTSSLMQISKSPTKMALKEMKRIPSRDIGQPMSVTAPVLSATDQLSQEEDCDKPPRLSPQISLTSPTLSRSRLQLKPATSPKLNIEQYLTVSNANISKLADSGISSIKTRKNGLVVECKTSPVKEAKAKTPEVSTSQNAEKKNKRDSLSRKQSTHGLIPWSKRSKEHPKKSGGWSWKTKGFIGKVYLNVSKNFQFSFKLKCLISTLRMRILLLREFVITP